MYRFDEDTPFISDPMITGMVLSAAEELSLMDEIPTDYADKSYIDEDVEPSDADLAESEEFLHELEREEELSSLKETRPSRYEDRFMAAALSGDSNFNPCPSWRDEF